MIRLTIVLPTLRCEEKEVYVSQDQSISDLKTLINQAWVPFIPSVHALVACGHELMDHYTIGDCDFLTDGARVSIISRNDYNCTVSCVLLPFERLTFFPG